MYKRIYFLLMYPIAIYGGWYVYNWFISNPLERYVMPIIVIWLPNTIGWNNFFILLGCLAGLFILGLLGMIFEACEKLDIKII